MRYILLIVGVIIFSNCDSKRVTTTNEHFNFIITPDLSNRIEEIYKKPILDQDLIVGLYEKYHSNFYNIKNRVIGQKDVIQFRFTNSKIIGDFNIEKSKLKMDLSTYNPKQRIEYLVKGGNKKLIGYVSRETNRIYDLAKNSKTGADIYNFLKKEVTETNIKSIKESKRVNGKKIVEKYRNILILITDGYIEAGLYGEENCLGKKCYYLSKSKVDEFREVFKKDGSSDLREFFQRSGYGIIPIDNPALKNVEVFVSEIYDRTLNRKTGSQTVTPNDFEIIKLFWADWLEKSGIKHYKLLDTSDSQEEFLSELKSFILEE